MAEGTEGAEQFEISSVISRAFEAIGANFLLFAGLALVLAGIPAFALEWWQNSQLRANGLDSPDTSMIFSSAYWGPIIAAWLVSMITNAVLQASLTRATVMHLSGERPGFVQCLTIGLSMILPMIAIGILLSLGVGFGFLLLIVPGVILWLMWSVVVPAYVQERLGVFASFGRSVELTKGARGKIFLLFVILVIGLWLLSIPAGLLIAFAQGGGSILLLSLVTSIVSALGGMVMVTVQASIYVELREAKEGIAPGDLEAIFA
jgi:hypothetical protein